MLPAYMPTFIILSYFCLNFLISARLWSISSHNLFTSLSSPLLGTNQYWWNMRNHDVTRVGLSCFKACPNPCGSSCVTLDWTSVWILFYTVHKQTASPQCVYAYVRLCSACSWTVCHTYDTPYPARRATLK